MKFKSVLLITFLIGFSMKSFAGQVEIAQWIPWSFVSAELKKYPMEFRSRPDDWNLQLGEWAPKAISAEIQITRGSQDIQISESGIHAIAQNVSGRISVQGLNIDQTILREINGHQIRVRVQAQCQAFQIQIHSFSVSAQASFHQQENSWAPRLSTLNLQIPTGSWAVSPITCQGPQGLDQTIGSVIQDSLNSPEILQETLKSWLAPQIDRTWKTTWNSILSENWQSLKVTSMGEPLSTGFFLKGQIEIQNGSAVLLPQDLVAPETSTIPQLVLSSEGFKALAEDNLKTFSVQRYDLQQIPAFKKIMKNRFLQIFVWPDLLHFSRKTPFYISTRPETTQLGLHSRGSGLWNLTMQARGLIQVHRKGQEWTYIHWGIGMSAQLQTQVKNSRLHFKTTNSEANVNWNFDEDYVQAFNPSSRISSTVLKEAGKALFENRSIEKELPTLKMNGREWKLDGWKQKDSLIWMDWKESQL